MPELFEQSRYAPKNRSVAHLLDEYSSKYKPVFEKVKSEWNPTIREFYRQAMGLRLYSGVKGKKAAGDAGVFIQIRPDRDDTFLKTVDELLPNVDFDRYAVMKELRNSLFKASLYLHQDHLRKPAYDALLADVRAYLNENSLAEPFKRLMKTPGKHRDLFGQYTYADQHVELFYMPLLIFCKFYAVDLQWAIVVVLAHELAHAYHHAGKDNDGRIWMNMPSADIKIKEGLAEYYTERFVIAQERAYPALRKAFDGLLKGSGAEYLSFLEWRDDYTVEHVRLALSLVRRKNVSTYEEFLATLKKAKETLS